MPDLWRRIRDGDTALFVFAGVSAALLVFLKLASEVMEGESRAIDGLILQAVRSATDGTGGFDTWLKGFMLDVTALGDSNTLIVMAAIASGFLLVVRRYRLAASLAGGLALGALLEIGLKHVYGRPRPDLVPHLVEVSSASFPSGHAMDSAMVYLTIAALLTRATRSSRERGYVFAVALALTLLIGASRIYLGVHWPTDVLAGWIAGSAWAALCSVAAHRLGADKPGPAGEPA